MPDTPLVPNFVYCVPDTFNVFLADDIKLDFPPDRLHLGFCYQLAKMPVIASSLKDGKLRLKVHGGAGEPNFPADMHGMLGDCYWATAKEATVALLKRRIADVRRALDSVLELPDIIDKHEGLLDGQYDEESIKYDYTTGDMIMILTTRIAPVLGSFVSDVAKLLIQYRRLRKEEQEAANAD